MSGLILALQFSLAQGKCYCSALGTGFLVPPLSFPVVCLVAILVVSVAPQGFACPHQPVLRCSWPGTAQKLFSTCIAKADGDTDNTRIASSSQEVSNTSASSVCRFLSASSTHSPALVVAAYMPAS